jgi:hypothetical protein
LATRRGQKAKKGEGSQNGTARPGQAEKDRQNKTAMTGIPGQNGYDRALE